MRTAISYRKTRGSSAGKNKLIISTVFVVLVLLSDFLLHGAIRNKIRTVGSSVFGWGYAVADHALGTGFFSSRRGLESQNRALADKVAQLEERALSYEIVKAENTALRTLVHVADATATAEGGGITAPIISSIRSSPYGTFMIGAGTEDRVAAGSLVLTEGGVVIGLVKDVGPRSSLVAEILAPRGREEGVIGTATVIVEGLGGGNGYAKVPRGVDVRSGDPVVSPRLGSRPIGVVGHVASSSASASQDVFLRIPANFISLRYVYVIPAIH